MSRIFRKATNDPLRGAGSGTMSELSPSYAPIYPFNNVLVSSESGHLIEVDDTPHAERVHIYHRSGSHIELRPDGSVKYKSNKMRQDVTIGDHEMIIQGDWKVTVDGAIKLYAREGTLEIQADSGAAVNVKGELKLHADNILLKAKQKISLAAPMVDIGSPVYMSLPSQVAPLFGVPVPVVAGLRLPAPSFPSSPGSTIVSLATSINDIIGAFQTFSTFALPGAAASVLRNLPLLSDGTPQLPEISQPDEISLSNPAVYTGKTVKDIQYRDRQFDTPDDVADTETYTAHTMLCNELGDYNG